MNLEIAILEVLEAIHPRMERQEVIVADVKNSRTKSPTTSDVERKLKRLEDKRQVIGIGNDDGTKWKVTDAGIARLIEYRG